MSNVWTGTGIVKRIHKGEGAKGAYAFLSIIPDGDKSHIDVAVWGPGAEGLNAGDRVKVVGRLGFKKDKQISERAKFDVWAAQISVDADQGGSITHDGAAKPEADEPF